MGVADVHPSAEELTAFTLGALEGEAHSAIEAHVGTCASCQECAAAAPDDTLLQLLRRAHARTGQAADTVATAPDLTPAPHVAPAQVVTFALPAPLAAPAEADDPALPDAVPPDLAGHERYRIVRRLGGGGMGVVYEAEHRVMQRPVALKVINRAYTVNAAAVERFRREVRAAARLAHPNIVTAYDAENAGATHFLVMEYVEGQSLGRLVQEGGPLPVAEACDYVRQAALGLQHAHERGMVHRDVKPDNLIRCADASVKVLDFGLAALTAERADGPGGLTDDNIVMGTPDYMAPEQAENARAADIRADVYSLGCTLYYLLTGSAPYPAATPLLKILAHRDQPPPSLRRARPDVPPGLAGVLTRMLAKKPEQRFQTPGEVAAALEPFAYPRQEKPRSHRWLWVAAALLAAVLAAGVLVHRIQTDTGELVITTESDNIEVVVGQGGKVVRVIDAETGKEIKLVLRSGTYELELKGAPEGLKLSIDKATLTRGETVLAKIERVPGTPLATRPGPDKSVPAEPGKIELLRRIPVSAPGFLFYDVAVSKGGKYALVTRDIAPGCELDVYDLQTGEQIFDCPGYKAAFLDGEHVVAAYEGTLRIYEAKTGKRLREGRIGDIWGMAVAPGGKHLVYSNANGCFLLDLTTMKEQHSWPTNRPGGGGGMEFSPDGKRLFLRLDNTASWQAWDVEKNRATGEAWPTKEPLLRFLPDGKTILAIRDGKYAHLDAATGKVLATLRPAELPPGLQQFAYVTRGHFLFGGFADGTVRLLALAAPQELARYSFPEGDRIRTEAGGWHACVAVSSDDRYAAVVTRRSLWIFRLPAVAPVKAKP